MKKSIRVSCLSVVVTFILASSTSFGQTGYKSKVESILKTEGYSYDYNSEKGYFKVYLCDNNNQCEVVYVDYKDKEIGSIDLSHITFYVFFSFYDETYNPSSSMLRKLNVLNSNCIVGQFAYHPGLLYYMTTLWYNDLDTRSFTKSLAITYFLALGARPELELYFNN